MTRRPTDSELAILQALWRLGPATVRQVHDALGAEGAYTTTLKMLQIMLDKELVTRNVSQRSHVYAAAVSEERTQKQLVSHLLDQAFSGSAAKLAARALSMKRATTREIDELRALLDAQEKKGRRK
jgi:predicted transcriptional regulator